MASRRRLLAVLLAFLVGAAMLFAMAPPAGATGGGYTHPDLSATADGCSAEVTVTAGTLGLKVHRVAVWRTGPLEFVDGDWVYDFIPPNGQETYGFDGLQPGPHLAKAWVSFWGSHYKFWLFAPFTVSPDDCQPTFGNGNFSGSVECTAACTVAVLPNEGEEKAHVEVNSNEFFKINLLLTEWKPPGQTFVKVEGSNGKDGFLPVCGNNGKPGINCYHVNTVKVGGNKALDYDVFWSDGDPRFKFG